MCYYHFRKRLRHVIISLFFLTVIVLLLEEDVTNSLEALKQEFYDFDRIPNKLNVNHLKPLPKKEHIAFLKVHKAASSTVQNILYRFGLKRNLTFVLPIDDHYIAYHANHYKPILPLPGNRTKYDILCNHATFNHSKFKELMYDDAFYLAIVRNPLDLFISAAYYYRIRGYEKETFIHDLITDPEQFEPRYISATRTFNYMAKDFGYIFNSIHEVKNANESTVASFISKVTKIFDFVMVVEHFDESLVMLKRYLNWSTKDIIYIKKNINRGKAYVTKPVDVTEEDRTAFKKRNHLDYAVYDTFLKLFLNRKMQEEYLEEEVHEFRLILGEVEKFCFSDKSVRLIEFKKSIWHGHLSLDRDDCTWMLKPEVHFWEYLKERATSKETTLVLS